MAKTRMTGFSRLLLFLLLFLPLAFVGISYAKGEDPIANFKNLVGMETTNYSPSTNNTAPAPTGTSSSNEPATFQNVQALREEITQLKVDLAVANERLARCKTDGVQ
ncbi:hypothetical protein [Neolewinella persica]|uniref:hypothetical protein n=1 Tax=Neolewinella persica TaxID=70998 RepID=UPI000477C077|nr:hypothetical protein [Neolewinella persica]